MISEFTIQAIRDFNRKRDWDQYHSPESLAKSISIEAGELLECFQWSPDVANPDIDHVKEELADVLTYCIDLSEKLDCDMDEIIIDKLEKTKAKYPVKKVKNNFKRYRQLHQ
ncbi:MULTISPECIES: nucleotide pyrophosphohydrolase [unclassified Bifidobacterium]|uniref:nucleotide pyrophosphohydrolase n=1 Tax=unclassified Bifidobacterium TaxID=2608897 RepID=UPI0023F9FF8F|nr:MULTISPECIES: nucleotide pyrophosphohydrolase [unclassified Bifidobacterium]WEV65355.1 nucleotide pyrophosphohydrolase [Bifidobacterium sp. ESL0764]WEV75842.1 nucleotide pyrophosphohydrolase [Bifidobacterium sp. ESL0800]